jgi:plasmid stabilization system protein ParE
VTVEARFRPAAVADLEDAYRWYEARRPGLGIEFVDAVEDALVEVTERPTAFGFVHRHVRRVLLRRFPYGLFFVVDGETIVVVACFHVRRDPTRWSERG